MHREKPSVLIIGAGAAGLAAARELAAANVPLTVLEARDRMGGRIHTERDANWPLPIEAGAEFIHGSPSETQTAIDALRLTTEDVPDRHFQMRGRRLEPINLSPGWQTISERLGNLYKDMSFAQFLRRNCSDLTSAERDQATAFVEGFDAADAEIVSALWLRESDQETGLAEGARRVSEGYDRILDYFFKTSRETAFDVRLQRRVTSIRWQRGRVEVSAMTSAGEIERYEGGAAIITVPLGVLQNSINGVPLLEFCPDLSEKRTVWNQLPMGHVIKLVILFSKPFWTVAETSRLVFLHVPESPFFTWWTPHPVQTPMLTGWSGGPRAAQLSKLDEAAIFDVGLSTLADCFQKKSSELSSLVQHWKVFNWPADPFSRGAYAYVPAHGLHLIEALGTPVENTLLFAGEATHPTLMGTVAGAIASGRRASAEVLRSLD